MRVHKAEREVDGIWTRVRRMKKVGKRKERKGDGVFALGIEVAGARAERSVWFAAKLPATAQAPNTLFTFDERRRGSTLLERGK